MSRPLIEPTEAKILSLTDETQYAPHGIVSRTILNSGNTRVVLFGFAAGQELTEHTSTSHAMVEILAGECSFALEGEWNHLKAGDFLYMPPNMPHAVKATKQFSMLLTLFKPVPDALPTLPKLSRGESLLNSSRDFSI